MLCPFALTHAWFVRFLTFLSSKNLRVIYHSLFCEVKLIRENNKHNSLSMKPNIFWILAWAAIAILECPFSRDRWAVPKGPGKQSSRYFFLCWKESHPWPLLLSFCSDVTKSPFPSRFWYLFGAVRLLPDGGSLPMWWWCSWTPTSRFQW